MSKVLEKTKIRNQKMAQDYLNGMKDIDVAKKYNLSIYTVKPILKEMGVYSYENIPWTNEEVNILKENYETMEWNKLLDLLPGRNKGQITTKASDLKIKRICHFWSEEDIQMLKVEYQNGKSVKDIEKDFNYRFSENAILSKARQLKIKKREFWTEAEIEVVKNNYSTKTMKEMCALLPNRSMEGIKQIARKNNLLSKYYLENQYTEDEENFIKKNYKYMTDQEISSCIGRTERSVKAKRENMGYLKSEYIPLTNIKQVKLKSYIRKHNHEWRKDSVKKCNSKCVITGEDFKDVHHLHSFDLILNEFLEEENLIDVDFNEYTEKELQNLAEKFYIKQSSYPLGVCLSKKIHLKFHSIYGYGKNTVEQFNEFQSKILSGEIKIA